MTHDYRRNGTTTLFAVLNMLDGKVIGTSMPRHRPANGSHCPARNGAVRTVQKTRSNRQVDDVRISVDPRSNPSIASA
jgi:hypothetical protein